MLAISEDLRNIDREVWLMFLWLLAQYFAESRHSVNICCQVVDREWMIARRMLIIATSIIYYFLSGAHLFSHALFFFSTSMNIYVYMTGLYIAYIYIYTYMYPCPHIHVYTFIDKYIHIYICIRIYIYTCIHTYIHVSLFTHIIHSHTP